MLRLMAPLLSFTTEEAWGHLPKATTDPESIHLALFPKPSDLFAGLTAAATADWDALVELRDPVMKSLETARQEKLIGGNLEAKLMLKATGDQLALLKRNIDELPALFIVSQVDLAEGEFAIWVERADGTKCERCWKYTLDVGSSAGHPTLCGNCAKAVDDGLSDGAWS